MGIENNFENLSIILPVYNEGPVIYSLLKDLKQKLSAARIIVVNDASCDNTFEELQKLEGITVINHDFHKGMGAALKAGMRAAKTDAIAWFDGDGQHRPEDLINVAAPVLNGYKDVVIGARQKDPAEAKERVMGKIILKWVAQIVVRSQIPDLNSGLRCFKANVIRKYIHLIPDGFSASTISTILMIKRGYRVGYVPIISKPRTGKSSVRVVSDGFRALHLIMQILILFEAFKFFLILSTVQIVFGLIYGFILACTRHLGFPNLAVIMIISGILTFFMGIISDQISELRKEKFEDI